MSTEIKQKAQQLGYTACGIIPAAEFSEFSHYLEERVKTFPGSKHLYEPLAKMSSPPEEGKSIIVGIRGFDQYKAPESLRRVTGKVYLVDGRVEYSPQYRAKQEFAAYLATLGINIVKGYVPLRWAAVKAGIGKFGRNNIIYSEKHGSHVWIDAWVVDKELEYEPEPESIYLTACSDDCLKCVRACPTKALSGSFSMDMGKCITHLIFAEDDELTDDVKSQMGTWLYGCDICQDACPCNARDTRGEEDFPLMAEFEELLKYETVLGMDEKTYKKVLNPRFWYGGEAGLWMWKRNALRAMINSNDSKYHQTVREYLTNEDERLRSVAEWGCADYRKRKVGSE